MRVDNLTITSVETITGFSKNTGDFKFKIDQLQNAAINNTQEKVDITGKQGRILNSLKRNKAVTVTGTNGLISTGLLSADLGADVTEGNATIMWNEILTVAEGKAVTTYKPTGTTGSEIESLYLLNENNLLGEKLEQDAEAASGKFSFTPASKEITFFSDVEDGTRIVVYYKRTITNTTTITNNSNNYSEKCILYIDAIAEDECNTMYRVQFIIFTADFSGDVNLEMGDNQTVHSFEATSLASGCTSDGRFWDMIIFGTDAEDAA